MLFCDFWLFVRMVLMATLLLGRLVNACWLLMPFEELSRCRWLEEELSISP